MARRAFTITDAFEVNGGLLLTPGVGDLNVPIRVGEAVELRRPDGAVLRTVVAALEMLHAPNPIPNPFVLLRGMPAADVPAGTEVWVELGSSGG
jgi:hypothetical protein